MTQDPPTAASPSDAPAPRPRAPRPPTPPTSAPLTPPPWAPAPPPAPPGYGPPVPGGYPPPPGYPFSGYGVQPPPYHQGPPGYGVSPGYPVPPPPPLSPAGQPLASFADRLLAYLIDMAVFMGVGAVLSVPAVIIFFAVIGPDLWRVQPDGTINQPDFFAFFLPFLLLEGVLLLVMFALYYVYYVELMLRSGQMFGQSGQTLGKKVMKIRVLPVDPDATLDRRHAAKRYLVQFVAGSLLPGFSYLDGLWQLWDKPYLQCLHDKFARTVVVKVPA